MNLAWDAFRILDNHSKSMIFMMPDDPRNEEYSAYIKTVSKHITLEAIRVTINRYFSINFLTQFDINMNLYSFAI
jgi:hypothetical protein